MSKAWRWTWRISLIVIALFILAAVGICLLAASWRHVPITPSVTVVTAPLDTDGFPDYLASLNEIEARNLIDTENAAPGFLTILGQRDASAEWWNTECRLLKIAPTAPATFKFYKDWLEAHSVSPSSDDGPYSEHEFFLTLRNPWSRNDYPLLASWIDNNKSDIDGFEALTTRTRFYIPLVTSNGLASGVERPSLLSVHYATGSLREAANAMIQRATLRANDGDDRGFEHGILAAIRFSELMEKNGSLFDYLVGTSIYQASMIAIQHTAAANKLSLACIDDLSKNLEALPPFPPPDRLLNLSQRYEVLDGLAMLVDVSQRGSTGPAAGTEMAKLMVIPIHFTLAFQETNRLFDQYRSAFSSASFTDRQSQIESIQRDIELLNTGSIPHKIAHAWGVLVQNLMPFNIGTSLNKAMTLGYAHRNLALLALKLQEYQAVNGRFPAALPQLPASSALQTDPFTGHPLLYKPRASGYLLYSVGADLHDDGGTPSRTANQTQDVDLVVESPLNPAPTAFPNSPTPPPQTRVRDITPAPPHSPHAPAN